MKESVCGLPIIIDESATFSCFSGNTKGSIELIVYDNETGNIPAIAKINCNIGNESVSFTMGGNNTFKKVIKGIKISVTISYWRCLANELRFHLKIVASKSFFNSVIFDKSFFGERKSEEKIEKPVTVKRKTSIRVPN